MRLSPDEAQARVCPSQAGFVQAASNRSFGMNGVSPGTLTTHSIRGDGRLSIERRQDSRQRSLVTGNDVGHDGKPYGIEAGGASIRIENQALALRGKRSLTWSSSVCHQDDSDFS